MANLVGSGRPTQNTVGQTGDVYTDSLSGQQYVLTHIIHYSDAKDTLSKVYVWGNIVKFPENLTDSFKAMIEGSEADLFLPSDLTTIREFAFRNYANLQVIHIPETVTHIGNYAFDSCANMTMDKLPDSLTNLGSYAFRYCSKLAIDSLPAKITNLAASVFYQCTSLKVDRIPASVLTVNDSAFYNCTGLTSMTFEGTPTSIAANAFQGCTNLTVINVPWVEGAVANAPWGATNATINYSVT